MPQLDPTWFASQLFWLLMSMLVLYLSLSYVFLPRLMQVMQQRKALREDDLARAQALKNEAESIRHAYEQSMQDARERAQALFAEVEQKSADSLARALASVQRSAAAETATAEQRINAQKDQLIAQLMPMVEQLAESVSHKLLAIKA